LADSVIVGGGMPSTKEAPHSAASLGLIFGALNKPGSSFSNMMKASLIQSVQMTVFGRVLAPEVKSETMVGILLGLRVPVSASILSSV